MSARIHIKDEGVCGFVLGCVEESMHSASLPRQLASSKRSGFRREEIPVGQGQWSTI